MSERRGGGRVLMGALWGYGAQILTIIFQLAYAAIVSRLLGSEEFGIYSVSLSITALISLIANGGMSQAVSRLVEVDNEVVGALTTFALLLGTSVAALTFLTADFWAGSWGVPAATATIRWLSLSAVISPLFSLLSGLARRTGRFSSLAVATVISNVLGMAVGALAVAVWRDASSLVVSAVCSQALIVVWLAFGSKRLIIPRRLSAARPHVAFSAKLVVAGILQYGVGNVGKWSAARVFGAPVMGQWNRAEVLTTIPMQQAQTAMVQAVYPEFRHDIESSARARRVWVDMLVLVAWISLPAGTVLAVLAPILIPFVLGSEWRQAAAFSIPLSIGVAVQPVSILLASALESLGSFKRIWMTDIVLFFLQVALVFWMTMNKDVAIVIWGIAITNIFRLLIHSSIASRIGYICIGSLYRGLGTVIIGCLLAVFPLACLIALSSNMGNPFLGGWAVPTAGLVFSAVGCYVAVRRWRELPPVKLAFRYGLLKPRRGI